MKALKRIFQSTSLTVPASALLCFSYLLSPIVSAQQKVDKLMEEVVVIGTRVQGRTVLETAVPVDIIGADDIGQSGITETSRLLQFLAPSFNFSTSTISDGTDIVRPSTLRGLGPDQTLVLVNGKRRHNSALVHVNGSIGRGTSGVDLNAIPSSSIDHIEILRDGAAAQYGSDAIAGVINIVLKNQHEHVDLGASWGETYHDNGETITASVNGGVEIGSGGFLNVTVESRNRDYTDFSGPDPRAQVAALPDGSPDFSDPIEAAFDRRNHRYGDAESENVYLFLNAELPLNDKTSLYAFGGVARRDGESAGFYRRGIDARNRPAIHPQGFLPLINTEVDDDSFSFGVRSEVGEWKLDTSVTWGENTFEFLITNSLNVSLGDTSPTKAKAGGPEFSQTTFNFDAVRKMDWGLPNEVNLALGFEYREDEYELNAGEFASYANGPDDNPATAIPDQFGDVAAPGIQVFPGFRPENEVSEDRESVAVYADVETNLTDAFLVGAALRYEDFTDFGENVSGKLTGRYQVTDNFALRGAVSTGFRAPALAQQYFNNTSTQFVTFMGVPNTPVEVGTFANDSPVVKALGVPELDEETSVNLSIGFVYTPRPNLNITADLYAIDIDDRIVLSGRFAKDPDNPTIIDTLLAPFPGVNAAQFFSNAIDTETRGVDLVVNYIWPMEHGGILKLSGAYNYTDTELDGSVDTPAPLAGLGETVFSRQEILWLEDGQPKDSINLAANYTNGGFALMVRLNRFGEVKSTESASDPSTDQTFDAKWIGDIEFSYQFTEGLNAAIGANNVADVQPDKNIESNSFNGIFPYNRRTTPFGFNGGYYYSRITYRF